VTTGAVTRASITIGSVFALFSLRAMAADLTGHWSLEGDVSGKPIRLTCDLKQEGVKLEGTCKSGSAEFQIAGEVSDPKVRFSYAVENKGSTYTLYYSGTLESESVMSGEIGASRTSGVFSARKIAGPNKKDSGAIVLPGTLKN
jgi:hypothetical protein